jgi:hypothetical protein
MPLALRHLWVVTALVSLYPSASGSPAISTPFYIGRMSLAINGAFAHFPSKVLFSYETAPVYETELAA